MNHSHLNASQTVTEISLQNWILVYLWNDLHSISFEWLIASLNINVFTELKLDSKSSTQSICFMV